MQNILINCLFVNLSTRTSLFFLECLLFYGQKIKQIMKFYKAGERWSGPQPYIATSLYPVISPPPPLSPFLKFGFLCWYEMKLLLNCQFRREAMLERYERLKMAPNFPAMKFSTPQEMFRLIEHESRDLCRWSGELFLELHNGTYTSEAKVW